MGTIGTSKSSAEQSTHEALVQHLKLRAADHLVWYHCPNGEYRSKRTAAKLKRMGVQAGVPDFSFVLPPHGYSAFLELKGLNGRLSAAQRAFIDNALAAGALVEVAHSLDEALSILEGWGALKSLSR